MRSWRCRARSLVRPVLSCGVARRKALLEYFQRITDPTPLMVKPFAFLHGGETVDLAVEVELPGERGEYELVFDLVAEGLTWSEISAPVLFGSALRFSDSRSTRTPGGAVESWPVDICH